jgi:hypothetical protein
MMAMARPVAALTALALLTGATKMDSAKDRDNPTCPAAPDFGPTTAMTLTPADRDGKRVLLAEGAIDAALPARLKAAIEADDKIEEVWLRSRGGNARAGNEAGKVIRSYRGMLTRIPAGWACFSACNFVFMGGDRRVVAPSSTARNKGTAAKSSGHAPSGGRASAASAPARTVTPPRRQPLSLRHACLSRIMVPAL